MNLKEIKDAARQAFRDQQTQDTEGGVPDGVSFIAGFVEGARHAQDEMLIATVDKLKEDKKKLVEALTKIAGRCSIAEDNKDKIHGPEAGVIFAAASAWRMEIAKQVLKEIGEE